MDLGLKGRTALVTGGSAGLGFAIAKTLSQEGARVGISSRSEERLSKAVQASGAERFFVSDFNVPRQAENLVKNAIQSFGKIDILICNTGGPPKGSFDEVSTEAWHQGFQNLWISTVGAIHDVLPEMRRNKWGRILLVTSAAAKEPMPHLTISNGLRAGLLGLVKSISNEIAGSGITINALLPGYTRTERLMQLGIPEEKITATIPAGRLGEPSEFADLAAFLASERAAYITGQAIACDGGWLKGI